MQFGIHVPYVHPTHAKFRSQNVRHCARSTGSGDAGSGNGVESAAHGWSPLGGACAAGVAVAPDLAPVPVAPGALGELDSGSTLSVPVTFPPHATVTATGAMPAIERRSRGTRAFMRDSASTRRAAARPWEIANRRGSPPWQGCRGRSTSRSRSADRVMPCSMAERSTARHGKVAPSSRATNRDRVGAGRWDRGPRSRSGTRRRRGGRSRTSRLARRSCDTLPMVTVTAYNGRRDAGVARRTAGA